MNGIEEIFFGEELIAIVVRKHFASEGYNFISKEHYPLQVGINFYKKGTGAMPHIHLKRKIELEEIQEIFRVEHGRVRANLYSSQGKKFDSIELGEGDVIFFITGGHGFDMLEDTKLLEIKQGPYIGKEKDKKMIEE